ncbi:MAG: hypothetical protein NTZ97_02785 [Candidatus Moranbacteria bacterium]|nr:hypothetical protein [Candidatus Moranbacteria bacterium]
MEKRTNFETYRNQLLQRVDHIVAGLSGMGLRLTMLKTQEIIELLYTSYNPQIFEHSDLGMVEQMDIR